MALMLLVLALAACASPTAPEGPPATGDGLPDTLHRDREGPVTPPFPDGPLWMIPPPRPCELSTDFPPPSTSSTKEVD